MVLVVMVELLSGDFGPACDCLLGLHSVNVSSLPFGVSTVVTLLRVLVVVLPPSKPPRRVGEADVDR